MGNRDIKAFHLLLSLCVWSLGLSILGCAQDRSSNAERPDPGALAARAPEAQLGADQLGELPLGDRIAEFIKAFNSGEPARIREFVDSAYHTAVNREVETSRWLRWGRIYGPIEPWSLERSDQNTLRIFARGRITSAWLELTARRSSEQPDRLRTIAVGTGLRPKSVPVPRFQGTEAFTSWIVGYLDRVATDGYFSGGVLLALGDEVLLTEVRGLADRSNERTNTEVTRFNIGSITKLFTATLVMRLVDRVLALDDPVVQWLPDYPAPISSDMTIRHLLTHTSGLGRGSIDRPIYPLEPRSVSEWLPHTVADPEFAPGDGISYSNGAFILLGAIAEAATGLDYDELLRTEIYEPARMDRSASPTVDRPLSDMATPYTWGRTTGDGGVQFDPSQLRSAILMNGTKGHPAGLTYSTLSDLASFVRTMVNGHYLSEALTKEMLSAQVWFPAEENASISYGYGFGWEVVGVDGVVTRLSKDGGSWGVSARLAYYPSNDVVLIVLSNLDSTGLLVADHIGEVLESWDPS